MDADSIPKQELDAATRARLEAILMQLSADPAGRFDYQVEVEEEGVLAELVERINQVLRSARKSVNEARKKSYFLARSNTDLKREAEARAKTEELLAESEARTRAIVESAAEGILTFDEEGKVLSCNRAARETFGRTEEELVGCSYHDLFHVPDGLAPSFDALGAALAAEAGEVLCNRADGSQFAASLSLGVFEHGGKTIYTAVCRDLSEVKRMQAQLAQAQKLESIGQLAAGIAHEINTPTQFVSDNVRFLEDSFRELTGVLEPFLETLRAGDGADEPDGQAVLAAMRAKAEEGDLEFLVEEVPSALSQSIEGLTTVANIVRSMKEFSHPGQSHKTKVDLAGAVRNTVTVARNEWKYVAEVDVEAPEDLPHVPCYESEFNQVVLNMLVNAAHALEGTERQQAGEGRIKISLSVAGDWVEVRLADNGCGIPPEAVSKVFDPFFTTKEVGRGTGQGLAIAHSVIVDKHGGEVSVEETSDQGTTFLIRLPLREERASDGDDALGEAA